MVGFRLCSGLQPSNHKFLPEVPTGADIVATFRPRSAVRN